MMQSDALKNLARDAATVLPQIDATAEHSRWKPGIGVFDEEHQVQRIVGALKDSTERYTSTTTETPYPNTDQRCDILLETGDTQTPVEVKLIRFFRDNGDLEPNAYGTVFSPFSNSLITDAQKLTESGFDVPGGLLGLYYEPVDEASPHMDAEKLAEKVVRDVEYWFDIPLETRTIAEFSGLQHPIHQQGAVIAWELLE